MPSLSSSSCINDVVAIAVWLTEVRHAVAIAIAEQLGTWDAIVVIILITGVNDPV